jgi:peptide/nickel transport system substrate-binding protein
MAHGSTDTARASYLSAHPIGTGPYMLDSWVKGQYVRLKKNANYWDASKYPMGYVEYDLIVNDNTRLLKVEAGELDVDNVLPFNQVDAAKANSAVQVQINKSTETRYFQFNTRAAPFDDVHVRQAINHIINRAAMAKAVTFSYGTPANSFIPAGAIDHDPNIPVPAYDPALAKKLLSESKVPHGFTMTMETSAGDSISNEQAQIFQSEAAAIGIKVNIQPVDPTTLFNNQQVDCPKGTTGIKLSQQAEQASDPATRQKLYFQIQQIWSQETHIIALYYVPFVNAVSTKVHGFSENPLGYFNLQGVTKS